MTSVAARFLFALVSGTLLGCSTDHDLLAQKPGSASDAASGDDDASDGGFPTAPRDGRAALDATDPEPPGPWVLTLVNGIVDVDPVRFCFVPVVDSGESPTEEAPVPAAPGLAFGEHVVLSHLVSDLTATDLHPYLVVGADGTATLSCADILRQQPGSDRGPSAFSLPLVPAGTLAPSRSYLAVANGCALPPRSVPRGGGTDAGNGDDAAGEADAGSASEDAGANTTACGTGFGPTTLGLSLVRLSRRKNVDKLGFQTVNGSNAATPAMLLIRSWVTAATILASDPVEVGQISPYVQPAYLTQNDLGTPVGFATLSVVPTSGASFPNFETTLASVLSASGVDEAALTDGSLFTFVLLGAEPGQTADPLAHGFEVQLVESARDWGDD